VSVSVSVVCVCVCARECAYINTYHNTFPPHSYTHTDLLNARAFFDKYDVNRTGMLDYNAVYNVWKGTCVCVCVCVCVWTFSIIKYTCMCVYDHDQD
jgi:hypothetical protein